MNRSTLRLIGSLIIVAGAVGILARVIITPQFVESYLSDGKHITPKISDLIRAYRLSASSLGGFMIIGGGAVLVAASIPTTRLDDILSTIQMPKRIVLVSAVGVWAILYLAYVLNHEIPVNPAGFYLESSRQLISNQFLIPKLVDGFGQNGIPFVFPPLAFYVIGGAGYLLGGQHIAALYIPGILLPLQAIAAYLFMKQWKGSERAAQWAAVVLLLVPHIFRRTMYGDGITTGLAGVFLLLSWRFAVSSDKPGSYLTSIVGGFFVGLSLLSHPAIGLLSAATFSILHLSRTGINFKAIAGLIASGITAFAVILPWLVTVISQHGIGPILAGIQDSKSFFSIFPNIENSLSYIYSKHTEHAQETIALLVFPFAVTILYSIVKGPRILLLLLFASIMTFKGHPSATMFVFAASLGIFYSDVRFPAIGRGGQRLGNQWRERYVSLGSWFSVAFAGLSLITVFWLDLSYVVSPTFASGEKATYDWIRANTESDSTFLMEGGAEDLVYFGRRRILLPVLGAEWVPSPEYGNGQIRNRLAKNEIFNCRELECLNIAFLKYDVAPDYLIYRISDIRDKAWIDELSASPMFELAFVSESMMALRRDELTALPLAG